MPDKTASQTKSSGHDYAALSLAAHEAWRGKIEVISRAPVANAQDLALAYTPGVAEACLAIHRDPSRSFQLTRRHNLVLVVTDGSAVLGLGNIGPEAAMPVMEGKCALFKAFGDVDAFPLCLESQDVDTIVETIRQIAPSFGGINLEDISAPRCFEIERRLIELLDIPVFHDDQHGTAIVTLAGLYNALRVTGKELQEVRIVINGAGAAAIATANLLLEAGAGDLILCDRSGILHSERSTGMNDAKLDIAGRSNPRGLTGDLALAMRQADVLIGVSAPGVVSREMVASMAQDAIVFACANPVPEIYPDEALAAGAAVVATGRSDFPNQINNVLAFPGVFRGALDVRAREINPTMRLAAARAIADLCSADELTPRSIIPAAFDPRVRDAVATAVAAAARETGVALL
ncbi:MAG: NADP-dependent malic enzyme [Bacillota bacterium]|nr:NADP-dependent malic enzyme [Bacillota bacterium]